MKTPKITAFILIAGLSVLSLKAGSPYGPVSFKLQAQFQDQSFVLASSRTNKTATSTNEISVFASSTTNLTVNNAMILQMLAHAYNTNLPDGAQLVIDSTESFWVVDKTGTNAILNPNGVMGWGVYASAQSGKETVNVKRPPGATVSQVFAMTMTQCVVVTYNDTSMGGTNKMNLWGLQTVRQSGDVYGSSRTIYRTVGEGWGFIGEKYVVLRGTIIGTAPGVLD